jgi:ribosomal protein S18 acetylase RimI-like enzyme
VTSLMFSTCGTARVVRRVHAEVATLFERDPEALLVAVIDGKVVGALIAGWDGWRCHIYRLAAERSRRRQGLARSLMTVAQTWG